jgi:hypothetical protein
VLSNMIHFVVKLEMWNFHHIICTLLKNPFKTLWKGKNVKITFFNYCLHCNMHISLVNIVRISSTMPWIWPWSSSFVLNAIDVHTYSPFWESFLNKICQNPFQHFSLQLVHIKGLHDDGINPTLWFFHSLRLQVQSDAAREHFLTRVTREFISNFREKWWFFLLYSLSNLQ